MQITTPSISNLHHPTEPTIFCQNGRRDPTKHTFSHLQKKAPTAKKRSTEMERGKSLMPLSPVDEFGVTHNICTPTHPETSGWRNSRDPN